MKTNKVTSKAANKDENLSISERIDGLALCLMHLEEETRQSGLELTAMLIRAAAESLSYDQSASPAPCAQTGK